MLIARKPAAYVGIHFLREVSRRPAGGLEQPQVRLVVGENRFACAPAKDNAFAIGRNRKLPDVAVHLEHLPDLPAVPGNGIECGTRRVVVGLGNTCGSEVDRGSVGRPLGVVLVEIPGGELYRLGPVRGCGGDSKRPNVRSPLWVEVSLA